MSKTRLRGGQVELVEDDPVTLSKWLHQHALPKGRNDKKNGRNMAEKHHGRTTCYECFVTQRKKKLTEFITEGENSRMKMCFLFDQS